MAENENTKDEKFGGETKSQTSVSPANEVIDVDREGFRYTQVYLDQMEARKKELQKLYPELDSDLF